MKPALYQLYRHTFVPYCVWLAKYDFLLVFGYGYIYAPAKNKISVTLQNAMESFLSQRIIYKVIRRDGLNVSCVF